MYMYMLAGNNSEDIYQASGAYAFRPNGTKANFIPKTHVDLEEHYVRTCTSHLYCCTGTNSAETSINSLPLLF